MLFRYLVGPFVQLIRQFSKEVELLGLISIMLVMLLITQSLDISMELGCFLGGFSIASAMPSSKRNEHKTVSLTKKYFFRQNFKAEELDARMGPLRDLFSIIFFTSIGFHVFPTFVLVELTILVWMTFVVVTTKFAIRLAFV